MASTEEKVQSAAELIEHLKSYYLLERKYITIDASERITKLLSWLLLTLILLGVGMLVLFLLLLTLIHVIGDLVGNMTIAYAVATVICVALLLFVWFRRNTLIVQPISRAIDGFLKGEDPEETAENVTVTDENGNPIETEESSPTTAQLLAELPDSKSELRLAIRLKEKEIKENYNTLIENKPQQDPTLGERIGLLIDRGFSVYRGATFAYGLISMLRGRKSK